MGPSFDLFYATVDEFAPEKTGKRKSVSPNEEPNLNERELDFS
jgi:hypothetical protein